LPFVPATRVRPLGEKATEKTRLLMTGLLGTNTLGIAVGASSGGPSWAGRPGSETLKSRTTGAKPPRLA
jgi:hypothetical protein